MLILMLFKINYLFANYNKSVLSVSHVPPSGSLFPEFRHHMTEVKYNPNNVLIGFIKIWYPTNMLTDTILLQPGAMKVFQLAIRLILTFYNNFNSGLWWFRRRSAVLKRSWPLYHP